MTEKNIRLAVSEEVNRAAEAKKAADLLYDNGLITDAVSKLYYYLLYHIRGLLLTKDLEPKSHESALRLFGLHFVKPGIFEPQASHIFSRLMKFREEADYNPSYTFTKEDYIQFREEAASLTALVEMYLHKGGFY
ncbi:MAG: HEPN domain-containing protein [Spirochaetota bacterium]